MKIGIDIDNVISNTFQDLAEYFNKFIGKTASAEEVVQIMRNEKIKMLFVWVKTWHEKVLTQIAPIDGAAETIKALYPDNKISLVTSRLSIFNRQTKSWLNMHKIPYHELHHAKEKSKHKKAPDCQVFIEDNIDECEVLAEHCERVFLMDHPWNRQKNIIRVNNWKEIRDQLK